MAMSTVAPTNRIYLSDVLLVLEVYGGAESLKSHARMSEDKFLISQYNNTEQVALTRHNGANIVEHDLPVHQNQCRKFFGRSPRFRLRRKIIYVPFRARSPLVGGGYIPSKYPHHQEWMILRVSFLYLKKKRIDVLVKLLLIKYNDVIFTI